MSVLPRLYTVCQDATIGSHYVNYKAVKLLVTHCNTMLTKVQLVCKGTILTRSTQRIVIALTTAGPLRAHIRTWSTCQYLVDNAV